MCDTAIGISQSRHLGRFVRQKLWSCVILNICDINEELRWMCDVRSMLNVLFIRLLSSSVVRCDKISLPYVRPVVSLDQESGCNLIISYRGAYSTFTTWKY
jgi:hypothetical protein